MAQQIAFIRADVRPITAPHEARSLARPESLLNLQEQWCLHFLCHCLVLMVLVYTYKIQYKCGRWKVESSLINNQLNVMEKFDISGWKRQFMWVNMMGVMLDMHWMVWGQRFTARKRRGLIGSNYPDVPFLPPTAPRTEINSAGEPSVTDEQMK